MKIIERDEVVKLIEGKKCVLIDVRREDEMKYGKINGSHNIPLSEIEKALEMESKEFEKKYGFKLSKKDRVIFYCRSGGRSAIATKIGAEKGFSCENYAGSILDWAEIDPKITKY
jgi:rhodanese-related sulfurtransferase